METMKTKKDVINKFKELEGKTIKVFTCDDTVVGCFKPKNSLAFFHMKGATMQKRVIKKVTKDRVVMQRTEINYIGFKDAEEFCDDWIYNFVSNLAISDTKTESRKKVQEDFKRQLKRLCGPANNYLYHYRKGCIRTGLFLHERHHIYRSRPYRR